MAPRRGGTRRKRGRNIRALVAEAEVRSLVEEHSHTLVGQLVAKAVLVRVVDPLGHPQEELGSGQTGRVPVGCKGGVKISESSGAASLHHRAFTAQLTPYLQACSPGSR